MLLLLAVALANDTTCVACCKAGGLAGCPTTLQVRTEKSATEPLGMGWELQGAWVVACDGSGRFDPSVNLQTDHEPEYGEVLNSSANPLAVHCFTQACALPRGVCIGPASGDGNVGLIGCDDTLPVDQRELAGGGGHAPGNTAMVVVIDGRPIVAEPPSTSASPASPPAVASPYYDTPPAVVPTPRPPEPAPLPAGPVALELPADPPDPCTPAPDAVRAESRKRVGSGDDFRIAGRIAEALKDYRAALTMDKCNGYAWMSIAQVTIDQGRTDLAIRALRNTTRLLPTHPGGWLMMGKAYETFGQKGLAAEAFKKATELAPGNAEAIEGYMRTR
ncbi:hypothetical protein LBMAG42_05900 [Deltaproteobacteria bacterium]|nr:hypothetical protein LBMAG42_05900 [Deltaproteobacteria bacterium]